MPSLTANLVDITRQRIYFAELHWENGIISAITPLDSKPREGYSYAMPGFVDAHIHIESSMLVPSEFARLAVLHGTVATVSDPHEIANVLGEAGVQFMLDNGKMVPFKFFFGAPSCVPATAFETAGATLDADAVERLLQMPEIKYLSEMMNFPGVIYGDEQVHKKIQSAHRLGKPVDGHAPGLRGETMRKYVSAGIHTDHECFTIDEALEKIAEGMKILIREGSAAKNFHNLINLLPEHTEQVMFCSDDKHPDDLLLGHINQLAARALREGKALWDVLRVACLNPIEHYRLEVGQLRVGDAADFIIVQDLSDFQVLQTYINGLLVADQGKSLIAAQKVEPINAFEALPKHEAQFAVKAQGSPIRVIEAINGELITRESAADLPEDEQGNLLSDTSQDVLKITVVNRYTPDAPPAMAFIRGFGLQQGAVASCVGHDSHNIIAVGTNDTDLTAAVNAIIASKGGVAAVCGAEQHVLPLPVAGIMSADDGWQVARQYQYIDHFVKHRLGSRLTAPFMTLSFMALLVIPQLKLSDKGLFDGNTFAFVSLFK